MQFSRSSVPDYHLLQTYLRERSADRLVLTFGEIEDLLGFALPPEARLEPDWWGTGDLAAPCSPQTDCWSNASRTATVTMSSQRVLFERIITREPIRKPQAVSRKP